MGNQIPSQISQDHHRQRSLKGKSQKLVGGLAGHFCPFLAQELAGNDCSSCGKSSKDIDDQHHDRIDKRNPRYRSFPNAGHHDRICKSHKGLKELIHHQRKDQFPKVCIGKKELFPVHFSPPYLFDIPHYTPQDSGVQERFLTFSLLM